MNGQVPSGTTTRNVLERRYRFDLQAGTYLLTWLLRAGRQILVAIAGWSVKIHLVLLAFLERRYPMIFKLTCLLDRWIKVYRNLTTSTWTSSECVNNQGLLVFRRVSGRYEKHLSGFSGNELGSLTSEPTLCWPCIKQVCFEGLGYFVIRVADTVKRQHHELSSFWSNTAPWKRTLKD